MLYVCLCFRGAFTCSSVGPAQDLGTGGPNVRSPAWPMFFPMIDDCHCDRIHSPLTAFHCFGDGTICWKEASGFERILCRANRAKEFQESMDRWTDHLDITEKGLKTELTLSQTTNFGLFQTKGVCRRQFQIFVERRESFL